MNKVEDIIGLKDHLVKEFLLPEDGVAYLVIGSLYTSDIKANKNNAVYKFSSKYGTCKLSDDTNSFTKISEGININIDFEDLSGDVSLFNRNSYKASYKITPSIGPSNSNTSYSILANTLYTEIYDKEEINTNITQDERIHYKITSYYYKILFTNTATCPHIVLSSYPEFDIDEFVTDKAIYYNAYDSRFHVHRWRSITELNQAMGLRNLPTLYKELSTIYANDTYEESEDGMIRSSNGHILVEDNKKDFFLVSVLDDTGNSIYKIEENTVEEFFEDGTPKKGYTLRVGNITKESPDSEPVVDSDYIPDKEFNFGILSPSLVNVLDRAAGVIRNIIMRIYQDSKLHAEDIAIEFNNPDYGKVYETGSNEDPDYNIDAEVVKIKDTNIFSFLVLAPIWGNDRNRLSIAIEVQDSIQLPGTFTYSHMREGVFITVKEVFAGDDTVLRVKKENGTYNKTIVLDPAVTDIHTIKYICEHIRTPKGLAIEPQYIYNSEELRMKIVGNKIKEFLSSVYNINDDYVFIRNENGVLEKFDISKYDKSKAVTQED